MTEHKFAALAALGADQIGAPIVRAEKIGPNLNRLGQIG